MDMDLTTFTAVGLLALATYKAQDLLRYLRALDWNGVVGTAGSWALGTGIAHLAAHSNITDKLILVKGAGPLGLMNGGALILLGIGIGSVGSTIADGRNAVDNSTSAAKPPIVPGPPG